MPYIAPGDRDYLDRHAGPLLEALEATEFRSADACYVVTELVARFVLFHGGPSWKLFREAESIALGAVLALREVESVYESAKRLENGDVPSLGDLRRFCTKRLEAAQALAEPTVTSNESASQGEVSQ